MSGRVIVDNNTGRIVRVYGCGVPFQIALSSSSYKPDVAWYTCLQLITIPIGESRYAVTVVASYLSCTENAARSAPRACLPNGDPSALPSGNYDAVLFQNPRISPAPPPVPILVTRP